MDLADDNPAAVHEFDLAVACFNLRNGIPWIQTCKTVQLAVPDCAVPGIVLMTDQQTAQRENAGVVIKAVPNIAATISIAGCIGGVIVSTFTAARALVSPDASR